MLRALLYLGALLMIAPAVGAEDVPFAQLDPSAYQSFVANWTTEDRPLCAVMESQADWDKTMRPAPTMGRTKPFAPPAGFWRNKAVLFVARVINAGDTSRVFRVADVQRHRRSLALDYQFTPTGPASWQMKWYLAIAVSKPLPALVRFRENGEIVCRVRIADVPR
jgi:hypothetical protein